LILKDKVYLLLIAFFSVLYLPQAFIVTEDLGLISGFEVDPGSIINSIEDLFKEPYYNMLSGYHSKYYGWSYYSINFFILAPIKLVMYINYIEDKSIIYLVIRLILFLIGLFTVIAFYLLAKKLYGNRIMAASASSLYMVSPVGVGASPFFFIHPETTGLLFIFLALLCLQTFIKTPGNLKIYYAGIACLAISALSKQVYFFMSLPIFLSFLHFHCIDNRESYLRTIFTRPFLKMMLVSILIGLGALFVIHPYAVFDFETFIAYQRELSNTFRADDDPLSLLGSFNKWLVVVSHYPLMAIFLWSIPPSCVACAYMYKRTGIRGQFLYVINGLAIVFMLALIAFGNRYNFGDHYLQPLYPFFILGAVALLNYLVCESRKISQIWSYLSKGLAAFAILFILIRSGMELAPVLNDRMQYKETVAYKTFHYINQHLTPDDKIVYDHFVSMPDALASQGCSYWHGCGTDYIDTYRPNYVIFNPLYKLNGKDHPQTERLKKYIADHDLRLFKTIKTSQAGKHQLKVYRKMDPLPKNADN